MKRYFTTGYGEGIANSKHEAYASAGHFETTMWLAEAGGYGHWVLYQDALDEIAAAKKAGYAQGVLDKDALREAREQATIKVGGVPVFVVGQLVYNRQSGNQALVLDVIGSTLKVHYQNPSFPNKNWFLPASDFVADPQDTAKVVDETDATTRKLLNELYHDRARLERVVKEAVVTFNIIRQGLNAVLDGKAQIDREDMANWVGAVSQFADLYAGE